MPLFDFDPKSTDRFINMPAFRPDLAAMEILAWAVSCKQNLLKDRRRIVRRISLYLLARNRICDLLVTIEWDKISSADFKVFSGLNDRSSELFFVQELSTLAIKILGSITFVEIQLEPMVSDVTSFITPKSRVMTLRFPNNPSALIPSVNETIPFERDA